MGLLEGVTAITAVFIWYYAWQTKRLAEQTKRMADEAECERKNKSIENKIYNALASCNAKPVKKLVDETGCSAEVLIPLLQRLSSPIGPLANYGRYLNGEKDREIWYGFKRCDPLLGGR